MAYTVNITSTSEVDIIYSIIVDNVPSGVTVSLDNGNFTLPTNNKVIFANVSTINYSDVNKTKSDIILDHIAEIVNEHATGEQYDEAGWGIEQVTSATSEPQETKQETGSLMDELERLGNMYEKGLLTEEEFTLAKKKLLEGE